MGAWHLARRIGTVHRDGNRLRSPARCWRAIRGASGSRGASRSPTSAAGRPRGRRIAPNSSAATAGTAAPAALTGNAPLSGATGAGLDPCAALQRVIELGVDEIVEVVWFVGQCAGVEEARALIERYRKADLDAVLAEVTSQWQTVLGTVQVKTPDRAMDLMLNGWLLYQTLACRVWARSAFYQASGAYGFRDQLQDGMALTHAQPDETRRHLLRAAARQFVEGDFQHWWLPQSGQGVRTRISDDRVWLAFATATYIGCAGDVAILDEIVPFLDGPPLLRPASTMRSSSRWSRMNRRRCSNIARAAWINASN